MMADEWPGPYAAIAKHYTQAGWTAPLPLPENKKDPVPSGFTGYRHFDVEPTSRDIDRWLKENPRGNVALRLPRDVLGIDVDAYDGKLGAASLRAAEERFGPLPATWRTTSRDDGVSGIRLFRVPEGMKWPNTVGAGIETIHRGHRYIVAPPSIHPDTGKPYLWVDPSGNGSFSFPRPSALPFLPDEWIKGLTGGELSDGPVARSEPPSDAQGWLTPGQPCKAVRGQLERAREALSRKGSRHDSMRDLILSVLFLGQQGHAGVELALKAMENSYAIAVGPDREEGTAIEWSRMMFGAFEIVAASPRVPEVCGGEECGKPQPLKPPAALTGPQWVVDPDRYREAPEAGLEATEDAFFNRRPELQHIRDFARSRMASPWATLGAVLVRVVCQVPPSVVLPALVGKQASLNLFVGIVGPSGSGKQAAEGAAEEAFFYGEPQTTITVGSGEGIVRSYVKYTPPKGEQPGGIEQIESSVLFRAAEIDTLAAVKGRSSATIMPTLRDAWTGDHLGWGYAAAEKRLTINAHNYRMGLVVGVQPDRADALLGRDESDGGTPQRFLWLPAQDPNIPDETPPEPERWHWVAPEFRFAGFAGTGGRRALLVPAEIEQLVRQAALDRHRGKTEALDGHALLARLKVAAALTFLAGRADMDMDDWDLAGMVMAKSDATRAGVVHSLQAKDRARDEAKLRFKAEETKVVEQAQVSTASQRIERMIRGRLREAGDWVSRSDLRRRLGRTTNREVFDEMEDVWVAAGWLERRTEERANAPGGIVRYRLREARGEQVNR